MTSDNDPMYGNTAASPELAETPVKLPEDNEVKLSEGRPAAGQGEDSMYRDTAARPELAQTPVKLPDDDKTPPPPEE